MIVDVIGDLDPVFAWDGRDLVAHDRLRPPSAPPEGLRGAAACVLADPSGPSVRVLRDPLGINKLFWAERDDGRLVAASRPHRLISQGFGLSEIRSVPRGAVIDLSPARDAQVATLVPESWHAQADGPSERIERVASRIAERVEAYLAAVAAAHGDREIYLCLSGGIDSTVIALLARRHIDGLVGVSFDLQRAGGRASADRLAARRLAQDLGLPLMEVTVPPDRLLEHLDTVLMEGVDWRGFNVHAGLVNAALAEAIAANSASGGALVLTGDMANEFLVDYHAEEHGGRVHYALPDLPPATMRATLVRGLESSNREVGVFGAWGLSVLQPYAAAVDEFLSVPVELLARPDAKQRLALAMLGDELPSYVHDRPKTRAQVGGDDGDGGVLGVCVDRGIDDEHLRARFAVLHGEADERTVKRFIRTGMYRAGVPEAIRPGGGP